MTWHFILLRLSVCVCAHASSWAECVWYSFGQAVPLEQLKCRSDNSHKVNFTIRCFQVAVEKKSPNSFPLSEFFGANALETLRRSKCAYEPVFAAFRYPVSDMPKRHFFVGFDAQSGMSPSAVFHLLTCASRLNDFLKITTQRMNDIRVDFVMCVSWMINCTFSK